MKLQITGIAWIIFHEKEKSFLGWYLVANNEVIETNNEVIETNDEVIETSILTTISSIVLT